MQKTATEKLKHPKVLSLAFFLAISERFGYYIMGFLLLLYVKAVYNFSDEKAFALFALFTALSYLVPVVGGYLADNVLGIKRCMGLGLIIEAVGFFLLALPSDNILYLYLAIASVVLGAGIFKTTPTNLLGRAYDKDDSMIDSGFTLYYMGINIGAFVSSLVAGVIADSYGYHVPFFIAGIGLVVGFVWFLLFKYHGKGHESEAGERHFNLLKWFVTIVCVGATIALFTFLISNNGLANLFFYAGCAAVFLFLLYQIIVSPKEDSIKILVCLILISFAVVFFILHFQLFQTLILFIERCVETKLLGILRIPTATYPGINALVVILLSPVLAHVYNMLEKHKKSMPVTTKFPLGLTIVGISFFVLTIGTYFAQLDGRISGLWVIGSIFLSSLGELLISALGLAMIAKIAPKRLYGVMMGAWYLIGSALAANLSGNAAKWAAVPLELQSNIQACLGIYGDAFIKMGLLGIAAAIVGFLFAPFLRKAAGL